MLPVLVSAAALVAVSLASLVGIQLDQARRRGASWQSVRLSFGRDVTEDTVVGVLDGIAGLPRDAVVLLDVLADHDGISFGLQSDQATLDSLRGPLGAQMPSLRIEPEVERKESPTYRWGRSIRLHGHLQVLRSDLTAETSRSVLSALQPLATGEALLLRWTLAPGRPNQIMRPEPGQATEPEERRRLRAKNAGSVVRGRGLIAVAAGHPRRGDHVIGRVSTVLRGRHTAYGHLRLLVRSGVWLRWLLGSRSLVFADRYSSAELAGLLAWPIDAPALPGLTLGTSPQLLPSNRLPQTGRVLGTATWPGAERPIAQPIVGALSHALAAGPTGVGKSTLLTHLICSDIAAKRGVVIIDGKGDTAASVLARIPKSREADVIYLDCASDGPLPGLKFLHGSSPELAADVVLGVFSDLFRSEWGPLSERYLRAGLIAVAHDPEGSTLADVPFVFTDAAYRRKLVGRLSDPLTRAVFAGFEAMSPGERQQQLAAPLGKLSQLIGRPVVRTVLGQVKPQLDFQTVLSQRKIVIISLAPVRVGAPAARLIGALSVFALFQAVQSRSGIPEAARKPAFVYLDEPKALGDLPMPLDGLLEQARGLGVGLTLAPQSMAQLPKTVRDAALTNVATRIVFRQDSQDAALLARDLAGVTPEELGDLKQFEAVARIGLGPGDLAPPVTIRTSPLPKPIGGNAQRVRALSEQHYGQTLEDVDAALTKRHLPAAEAPVGRKRRAS